MAANTFALGSLRRTFITPEGVDLRLELGSAGSRAAAFLIDCSIIVGLLGLVTFAVVYASGGVSKAGTGTQQALVVLWLIGAFILRNGWFSLFEMGTRGATPGKRLLGLRVVARDGSRLTGAAVVARNAMREIEIFLPLSFLVAQGAEGAADTFLIIFALLWSGIFLFFPLFNRDRLRIGDLIAGTWVIHNERARLLADLVGPEYRCRRSFPPSALEIYGVYELQMLEDVLRNENPAAVATVARTIRAKAELVDDGDDYGFLADYYAALCAHMEGGLLVGRRRENKFAEVDR